MMRLAVVIVGCLVTPAALASGKRPVLPADLRAEPLAKAIQLSWVSRNRPGTLLVIWRSEKAWLGFRLRAQVPENSLSFLDEQVEPGKTYRYCVYTVYQGVRSCVDSGAVSATIKPPEPAKPPAAAKGPTANDKAQSSAPASGPSASSPPGRPEALPTGRRGGCPLEDAAEARQRKADASLRTCRAS